MNTTQPAPARRRGQRKTSAAKAAAAFNIANRRRQVAQLYRQGLQQKEIAETLGVSEATICNDIAILKANLRQESQDDIRALVAEEAGALNDDEGALRVLLESAAKSTSSADPKAVLQSYQMILSIMRRRAALLGLDGAANTRVESSELDEVLSRLK